MAAVTKPNQPHRGAGLTAWLAVLRLHFYPVSWLAYGVGAAAAAALVEFQPAVFWFGLAVLLFLEAATVLSNEYVDYPSDRVNRNHSAFTGGSRVLVEQRLSFAQVRLGIWVALLLTAASAAALVIAAEGARVPVLVALVVMVVLTLGYTLPPLKLSYRGLGEFDVAAATGAGVLLCGFVFQGAPWQAPLPWWLAGSLSLAILPGITLAGIPDLDADRQVGKRTLAVLLDVRGACAVAAVAMLLSAGAALLVDQLVFADEPSSVVVYVLLLAHAGVVLVAIGRVARDPRSRRISGPMVLSLSYVLWFVALPLVRLLW